MTIGFEHLFEDTVWVSEPGAKDANGDATYGAVTAYTCRIEETTEQVNGPGGVVRAQSTKIWGATGLAVGTIVRVASSTDTTLRRVQARSYSTRPGLTTGLWEHTL